MAAERNRRHILIPNEPIAEPFRPHPRSISEKLVRGPIDRRAHAEALSTALRHAHEEALRRRADTGVAVVGASPGLYIQFESPPGIELKLESLEDRRKGIELLAVQTSPSASGDASIQLATVFVPDGALKHFFTRFEQYATQDTKNGEPRHKELVERIAALRLATLRALWTDDPSLFPAEKQVIWWEVWLRRHDGQELERFHQFAIAADLTTGLHRLAFDDRIVVLVRGTAEQLSKSLDVLNDLAEVRRAKESAGFFRDMRREEQAEWARDLLGRLSPPPEDAPAVCMLDTGVTRDHPLLQPLISPSDATAVDPSWGGHDDGGGPGNKGHGTEMAGLAAYGDLVPLLTGSRPVQMRHRLESVKILPPRGANEPQLYGAITAQAVSLPEIAAPHRPRVFCLAVTAPDQRDRGQPTSWSAALDALAAGRTFDPTTKGLHYIEGADEQRRLFVVSAGNVPPDRLERDHLSRSDIETVHDPAQAWNVLTVGAYTEKAVIQHEDYRNCSPISRPGELSPWSTTSLTFEEKWPIKPEVVFEGGNIAYNGRFMELSVPDLCMLSTHYKPHDSLFELSYATSAATAQVARMAAIIQAEYPEYWPETIRALIVHSARWTPTMQAHFSSAESRRNRGKLIRRYGFGVPSLERCLRSANDALTLVVQATLHPFKDGKMREMHLHFLPWPRDVLMELGDTPVRLRVTLSYFIEPNPGRRGWTRRHRYASHGLRFEVKLPTESIDDFRKRVNRQALAEDESKPIGGSDASRWFLGPKIRNKGSIHSDIWEGTASELAERGVIGVYPVSGWWKDQPKRDRSDVGARYALIVSLEVEAQEIDIWTPVAIQVGVPVEAVPLEI